MDRTSLYRALGPMARSGWLLIQRCAEGSRKGSSAFQTGIARPPVRRILGKGAEPGNRESSVLTVGPPCKKAMTDLTALGVRLGGLGRAANAISAARMS